MTKAETMAAAVLANWPQAKPGRGSTLTVGDANSDDGSVTSRSIDSAVTSSSLASRSAHTIAMFNSFLRSAWIDEPISKLMHPHEGNC